MFHAFMHGVQLPIQLRAVHCSSAQKDHLKGPSHINTMIVKAFAAVSQLQLDGRVGSLLRTWYSRRETPDARTIPCFPGVIYYHVPLHNTSGGATRRQAHDGSARICSSVARAASAAASLSIAAGSCNAIMLVASSPAS